MPGTPDLADLAEEFISAQEDAARANARLDAAKARLRAAAPLGKTQIGDATLTISPNRTFNQERALAAIPDGMLPLVSTQEVVTKVDKKKVEVIFEKNPDILDACFTVGENRVSLK